MIGGKAVMEIRRAGAWRSYELRLRETPLEGDRPDWLARPEAAALEMALGHRLGDPTARKSGARSQSCSCSSCRPGLPLLTER